MLIAQISDLHLGATNGDPDYDNDARLDSVLARLREMRPSPDLLILSGDLAESGQLAAYRNLAERLRDFPCPMLFAAGNHDRREAMLAVFPELRLDGGFLHAVHDAGGVRIVVLDSVEEGLHGGAFCADRAEWLRVRLDEAPDQPTIIVLHHPPIETGIAWMTVAPHAPWVGRLAEVLKGRTNISALLCGHLHRPIVSSLSGVTVMVCPSTAPPVALELAPIESGRPDGRPLILADPPGFALHLWTGERLVSHFETLTGGQAVARLDRRTQPAIEKLAGEAGGRAPPLQ